jgi:hypothetical protein
LLLQAAGKQDRTIVFSRRITWDVFGGGFQRSPYHVALSSSLTLYQVRSELKDLSQFTAERQDMQVQRQPLLTSDQIFIRFSHGFDKKIDRKETHRTVFAAALHIEQAHPNRPNQNMNIFFKKSSLDTSTWFTCDIFEGLWWKVLVPAPVQGRTIVSLALADSHAIFSKVYGGTRVSRSTFEITLFTLYYQSAI